MRSSVIDIFCPLVNGLRRRFLPFLNFNRSFLDHKGKAIALLWQLYLVAGPNFTSVRAVLDSVVSMTVDMGDTIAHCLAFDKKTKTVAVGCSDAEIKMINMEK